MIGIWKCNGCCLHLSASHAIVVGKQ